jgi:hypothetical protein
MIDLKSFSIVFGSIAAGKFIGDYIIKIDNRGRRIKKMNSYFSYSKKIKNEDF